MLKRVLVPAIVVLFFIVFLLARQEHRRSPAFETVEDRMSTLCTAYTHSGKVARVDTMTGKDQRIHREAKRLCGAFAGDWSEGGGSEPE